MIEGYLTVLQIQLEKV